MHDLKPLILPNIVAQRQSSKTSLDMSAEPTSSVYSSADSGFFSASSDCSTPPTPNFHSRGHFRYPSSTSSLSSSPPSYDMVDAPNASGKLPKLAEEPIEREDDYVTIDTHRCSCENELAGHEPHCAKVTQAYSFAEEYLSSNDSGLHLTKRRRSMESSSGSITNKIERRFPSFSRKVRERKRASTWSKPSRSTTPSRTPLTPSSSVTSIHQVHSFDLSDSYTQSVPSTRASEEHLSENTASSPIAIDVEKANAFEVDPEELEAERFATTPLLPPMLISRLDDLPASSPLQSPTVADGSQSLVPTPFGTPPVRAYPTPPLSSKPSVASFKTMPRPGHMVPSSEIPPMMLADPNDKWANALGHANFTILPEPYIPDICDALSLRQLFNDWEQARCNYAKHQVRTAEHYGVTSKHYQLTEQKWQEIDSMWKKNNDLAISRAAALGAEPEATSPVEPAPLNKMPSLNDPKSEGKFPKLGDEDIVGPMVQIASQIQKTPPRKRAFFRFLNDLRFPGSFLGRSSTGVRGY